MDRVDKLRADFNVEIDYRPFFLHPEIPRGGLPAEQLYGGNPEYYKSVLSQFSRMAKEVGLPMGKITTVAHTKLPLVMAEVAKEQGLHEAYHRATFHAYWAEGQNIGEWKVLEPIARAAGLKIDVDDLQAREQELNKRVDDSFAEGRRLGVTGIPTFFIGDERVVGAHPYAVIKAAVERSIT